MTIQINAINRRLMQAIGAVTTTTPDASLHKVAFQLWGMNQIRHVLQISQRGADCVCTPVRNRCSDNNICRCNGNHTGGETTFGNGPQWMHGSNRIADITEADLIATIPYTNGQHVVHLGDVSEQINVAHRVWIPEVTAYPVKVSFGIGAIALDENDRSRAVLMKQTSSCPLPLREALWKANNSNRSMTVQGGSGHLRTGFNGAQMDGLGNDYNVTVETPSQSTSQYSGTGRPIGFTPRKVGSNPCAGGNEDCVSWLDSTLQRLSCKHAQWLAMMGSADVIHRLNIS